MLHALGLLYAHCILLLIMQSHPVHLSDERLHLQVVRDVEEADFVLAHGTEVLGLGDGKPPIPVALEEIKSILQRAAEKGLPLIVANPDVVTVSGNSLIPMPGTFARWYNEFGGEVRPKVASDFSVSASLSAAPGMPLDLASPTVVQTSSLFFSLVVGLAKKERNSICRYV